MRCACYPGGNGGGDEVETSIGDGGMDGVNTGDDGGDGVMLPMVEMG